MSRSCVSAKQIAVTRRGLPGPPGIFQANYDCESNPKNVLLRVSAVATSAGPWTRQPPAHVELRKAVSSAVVSVQTPARRPIGYVTIADKKLRLWISPDCVRG